MVPSPVAFNYKCFIKKRNIIICAQNCLLFFFVWVLYSWTIVHILHFPSKYFNFKFLIIMLRMIYCIYIRIYPLLHGVGRNNIWHYYASPSSGDAYRDQQLTTNFELRVEIFCVPTCFHVRIPKPCLSVCTPSEEVTIASSILVLH